MADTKTQASDGARRMAQGLISGVALDLLPGHLLASLHVDIIGKLEQKAASLIDAELALRKDIVQARRCHVQPCDCGYCGLLSLLARWRVKG